MAACFHCGLPADEAISCEIDGVQQYFCCPACLLVAQTIHQGGLDGYYRFRDQPGKRPISPGKDFSGYDLEQVQSQFVSDSGNTQKTARLSIDGIHCAACAWLIEKHLQKQAAVESVRVNASTRSCILRWHNEQATLSQLMAEFERIGYSPQPEQFQQRQSQRRKESQQALLRLGIAGIAMMQVGMVAVALYAGGIQGIDAHWQVFLRWVSLVIATPVVLFSAQPFFRNAFRALRVGHLNMDVPVALAIGLAYAASVWATVTRSGEVYFDSVSMFTFFLLLGRYLEMRARNSSAFASENLQQLLPLTVTRLERGAQKVIPLAAVNDGDSLYIAAGEVIPADGVLESAQADVDESLLTGESAPVAKQRGDALSAGTMAIQSSLELKVTATGEQTQLAAIEKLVTEAALRKPTQVALADRVAAYFVAAVLVIACLVGMVWWYIDPGKAFWVVLSVLVVTCPCALSLATPAALTAGINRARRLGILVTGVQAMDALSRVDTVAFDKTGTLTEGQLSVDQVVLVGASPATASMCLDVIAAMEAGTSHPIAQAFVDRQPVNKASAVEVRLGEGVSGLVDQQYYRFGRAKFALDSALSPPSSEGLWQLLSSSASGDTYKPLAWISFSDSIRPGAAEALADLRASGKVIALISGDRHAVVNALASKVGVDEVLAEAKPSNKLAWVQRKQAKGYSVLMVGDGINDVPILSAADVSLAMGSATQLAQSRADSVLISGRLDAIPKLLVLSRKVRQVVRQNLAWALLYNLLALPAAAMGFIPPYLAAVGMSFSSLLVVLNAMRV